jgi:hypothetical protein
MERKSERAKGIKCGVESNLIYSHSYRAISYITSQVHELLSNAIPLMMKLKSLAETVERLG